MIINKRYKYFIPGDALSSHLAAGMLSLWTLLVSVLYFSSLSLAGRCLASLIVDDADGRIRYSAGAWKPESANDIYIRRELCLDNT